MQHAGKTNKKLVILTFCRTSKNSSLPWTDTNLKLAMKTASKDYFICFKKKSSYLLANHLTEFVNIIEEYVLFSCHGFLPVYHQKLLILSFTESWVSATGEEKQQFRCDRWGCLKISLAIDEDADWRKKWTKKITRGRDDVSKINVERRLAYQNPLWTNYWSMCLS